MKQVWILFFSLLLSFGAQADWPDFDDDDFKIKDLSNLDDSEAFRNIERAAKSHFYKQIRNGNYLPRTSCGEGSCFQYPPRNITPVPNEFVSCHNLWGPDFINAITEKQIYSSISEAVWGLHGATDSRGHNYQYGLWDRVLKDAKSHYDDLGINKTSIANLDSAQTQQATEEQRNQLNKSLSYNLFWMYVGQEALAQQKKCGVVGLMSTWGETSDMLVPKSKQSSDGKIHCVGFGLVTQDYDACVRLINAHDAANVASMANSAYMQVAGQAGVAKDISQNIAGNPHDATAHLKAQKSMAGRHENFANMSAGIDMGKISAIYSAIKKFPTRLTIVEDAQEFYTTYPDALHFGTNNYQKFLVEMNSFQKKQIDTSYYIPSLINVIFNSAYADEVITADTSKMSEKDKIKLTDELNLLAHNANQSAAQDRQKRAPVNTMSVELTIDRNEGYFRSYLNNSAIKSFPAKLAKEKDIALNILQEVAGIITQNTSGNGGPEFNMIHAYSGYPSILNNSSNILVAKQLMAQSGFSAVQNLLSAQAYNKAQKNLGDTINQYPDINDDTGFVLPDIPEGSGYTGYNGQRGAFNMNGNNAQVEPGNNNFNPNGGTGETGVTNLSDLDNFGLPGREGEVIDQSSGFETRPVGAAGVKRTPAGGGGGSGSGGGPSAGATANIQKNSPGNQNAMGAPKVAGNYGKSGSKAYYSSGSGGKKSLSRGKSKGNPFSKLFNKKRGNKGGVTNFRSLASKELGGTQNIFDRISNAYTLVKEDKRVLEYSEKK